METGNLEKHYGLQLCKEAPVYKVIYLTEVCKVLERESKRPTFEAYSASPETPVHTD